MYLEELCRRHALAMRAADCSPGGGVDRQVYLAIAQLYAGRIEAQRRRYGGPVQSGPIELWQGPGEIAASPAKEGT